MVIVLSDTKISHKELAKKLNAGVDNAWMPRATRMPLGLPAQMWVTAGMVDIHGKIASESDVGWY